MKKKIKRYQDGGLAGIADTANSLMNEVDGMANTINYGTTTPGGTTEPLGFTAVSGMKKGGKVKAYKGGGYRKVADGIASKGKTKGRMV